MLYAFNQDAYTNLRSKHCDSIMNFEVIGQAGPELEKMSNQGQVSQDLDQDIVQLENIIQQLKAEIDNINANTRCRQLAHITTRFLTILISRAEEKLRTLRQNQN